MSSSTQSGNTHTTHARTTAPGWYLLTAQAGSPEGGSLYAYLPRFLQRRAFKWAIVLLNVRVDEVICPQARCHRRPDAISVATASDFTGFIRFVLEYLGFVFVHDDAPPWAFRRLTNGVGSGRTNNNVRTDWVRSWPSRCQQTFNKFFMQSQIRSPARRHAHGHSRLRFCSASLISLQSLQLNAAYGTIVYKDLSNALDCTPSWCKKLNLHSLRHIAKESVNRWPPQHTPIFLISYVMDSLKTILELAHIVSAKPEQQIIQSE
jgi:hypothetical protein